MYFICLILSMCFYITSVYFAHTMQSGGYSAMSKTDKMAVLMEFEIWLGC